VAGSLLNNAADESSSIHILARALLIQLLWVP
jgi:hypothetical protein